jgi:hypothetical protein
MLAASAAGGIHQGECMPYSHSSRPSHEESSRANRAGERVWMEALEGRVLLAQGNLLDLSEVVVRSGRGEAEFRFEAKAAEKYLFINTLQSVGIHVTDQDGAEVDDAPDGATRVLWEAQESGTYFLWLDGGEDGNDSYELVAQIAGDDFGDTNHNAATLKPDQPIHGAIEDFDDRDVFEFQAQAGERWAFDTGWSEDEGIYAELRKANGRSINCTDGCEPMPYTGKYICHHRGRWRDGAEIHAEGKTGI